MPAVESLSEAYTLTGNAKYAHKCAVLLDRIADIFPTYDGNAQHYNTGWKKYSGAYVTDDYPKLLWLIAAAMAYDRIFEIIRADDALASFLRDKAAAYGSPNPKMTPADVCRNVEQRIILEALSHPERFNYNGTSRDSVSAIVKMALYGTDIGETLFNEDILIGKVIGVSHHGGDIIV